MLNELIVGFSWRKSEQERCSRRNSEISKRLKYLAMRHPYKLFKAMHFVILGLKTLIYSLHEKKYLTGQLVKHVYLLSAVLKLTEL